MGDVDELVTRAWTLLRNIIDRGEAALDAGADAGDVAHVVMAGLAAVEDVETYALLAASADARAHAEIERLIRQLRELRESMSSRQEG